MAIILVGAILRAWHLLQPIRYDEAATWLSFARLPWEGVVSDYRYPNNHILHTLLVKASAQVFGNTPWALRLPALIAGLATIPLTWLAARRFWDDRVALIAAALVTSSGALALYSTNARGYSMVVDATLLLLWIAASATRAPRGWHWPAYAVVGALGLWTIPVMLYPLGGVTLWVLATTWSDQTTRRLGWHAIAASAGAGLLAALLYAPVLAASGIGALVANPFVRPRGPELPFMADLTQCLSACWSLLSTGTWGVVAALLLGLSAVEVTRDLTRRRISPLLAMLIWLVVLVVVTRRFPFARVWLFIVPILAMSAAAVMVRAIDTRRNGALPFDRVGVLAIGLALLLSAPVILSKGILRSTETGALPDAREMILVIRAIARPGDHIHAGIEASMPLAYWADRLGLDDYYLHGQPAAILRNLVVINYTTGESLVGRLQRSGLMPDQVDMAQIGKWPSGEVVLITLKP